MRRGGRRSGAAGGAAGSAGGGGAAASAAALFDEAATTTGETASVVGAGGGSLASADSSAPRAAAVPIYARNAAVMYSKDRNRSALLDSVSVPTLPAVDNHVHEHLNLSALFEKRSPRRVAAHAALVQTFGAGARAAALAHAAANRAPALSAKEKKQKELDDALARLRGGAAPGGDAPGPAVEDAAQDAAQDAANRRSSVKFNRRGSYFGLYRDPVAKT